MVSRMKTENEDRGTKHPRSGFRHSLDSTRYCFAWCSGVGTVKSLKGTAVTLEDTRGFPFVHQLALITVDLRTSIFEVWQKIDLGLYPFFPTPKIFLLKLQVFLPTCRDCGARRVNDV